MSMPRNRNGHVSNAVKLALMAGSLPLVASQTAFAQEEEGAAELEEITVTGSRIPARNLISSSPVTTLSSSEISFQGVTRIEDMLNRLPQHHDKSKEHAALRSLCQKSNGNIRLL